jgi:hypothetical protein
VKHVAADELRNLVPPIRARFLNGELVYGDQVEPLRRPAEYDQQARADGLVSAGTRLKAAA